MIPYFHDGGTCMRVEKMLFDSFTIFVKRLPQFFLINNTFDLHFFALASWRE